MEERIPGAIFFDIDDLSDDTSDLPHMLPPPEKFASRMRKLGIGDGTRVVAYDTKGMFSAARAWWMFRVFGHDDVAILDGGFPKWKSENKEVRDGPPRTRQEKHFTARTQSMMVLTTILSWEWVMPYIEDSNAILTGLSMVAMGLIFDFYIYRNKYALESYGGKLGVYKLALITSVFIMITILFYSSSENFIYFQYTTSLSTIILLP